MTNHEKIKNMSVEEMAKIITGDCDFCAYTGCCRGISCRTGAIDWLESEAEDE